MSVVLNKDLEIQDKEKTLGELCEEVETISSDIQPNVLNAYLSSYKYSSAEYTDLTLSQNVKIGDKLSISNGKIVVGNNVNHIRISANLFFDNATNIAYYWCHIMKNSSTINSTIINSSKYFISCPIPAMVISVSSGDTIYLRVNNPNYASYQTIIRSGINNTWLNVEVID